MSHPSPPRRLRTVAVAVAVAAAMGIMALPATTTSAATAAPAAAPGATGTASGFLFYVYPDPQPVCGSPVGLNATADPAVDRAACAFVRFTGTDTTGAVTADLYSGDAPTAFLTGLPATESATTPGSFTLDIVPDGTWPAGPVRVVVKDTTGPIGEYRFQLNALRTSPTAPGTAAPGDTFPVSGTMEEVSGRLTFLGGAVPASFKVQLTNPDGTAFFTSPVQTAAGDGTFTYNVPAGTTSAITADASTGYQTTIGVRVVDAAYTDSASLPPTGAWAAPVAGSTGKTLVVPATDLTITNSFVSSVGWVKPGDSYPSRIIVSNPTGSQVTPTVDLTAPAGTSFQSASGPGTHPVAPASFTWSPGPIAAGTTVTLVLDSLASTTAAVPTVVWRDLSSTAVLKVPAEPDQTAVSHGPKVIPPSSVYDTARYGDRPFPIVPIQYTDRPYQGDHSGDSLERVINDPDYQGSTFNLYQEMSLGQLYPNGDVPSAGIAQRAFDGDFQPAVPFTSLVANAAAGSVTTCHGATYADLPAPLRDVVYPDRITNGVYNLPGDTDYYGDDTGSAVAASAGGVAALQDIDSGCGPTAKIVADAVALADPEIDYSDYDTDKDGVVDFFMGVFAGCGGNGASQLAAPGDPLGACPYDNLTYDNIWPHSSSLEGTYSDPVTGLPGVVTNDQLKDLQGRPLCWTDDSFSAKTTDCSDARLPVMVRVGPYNLNPETAIDSASVISHEYGHSLGLPDFYSISANGRETYGSWMLMAEDHSQDMDAYGRQELGWVVPQVLTPATDGTKTGITDSKQDTDTITWQQPDGTPYTLTEGQDGVGRVQNSQMFVAKLPGRKLLDESAFDTGDTASKSHLWWSGSGNDFGCTPTAGHNFDLSVPELATLDDPNATVTLSFKSRWDIEWDYDYGFVLTTTDGGQTYISHASQNGYTTGTNTIPPAASNNVCQDNYGNGLTGTSGSYAAGTEAIDRVAGNYPEPQFLADSYDISDLAGADHGAIRFSYATDPGLARPGWFIDDVKVTVDPDGAGGEPAHDAFVTDFESSGGPTDPHVFNGGCRDDLSTAKGCTLGWRYLQAGAASEQDHAYYMEMRDRSGFDDDGHGQADRGPVGWAPGFYLSYTDEAHGYGNVGTDDPPAQSPLDSTPQPGSETPNLDDAAFTAAAGKSAFSDSGAGHVDNYTDPTSASGNWEFAYDCLGFSVDQMSGQGVGPQTSDGDLTGDVTFDMGSGCGDFDYGYVSGPAQPANTAPAAKASATPQSAKVGQQVTLSAAGSTDAETPDNLTYSWSFGDGGTGKDASGQTVTHAFPQAGTYIAKVTVSDPDGLNDAATAVVTVTDDSSGGGGPGGAGPVAKIRVKPKHPGTDRKVRFVGKASTGTGALTYAWNFHNGGKKVDATGKKVKTFVRRPGRHKVTLTVTDSTGATDKQTVSYRVRTHFSNRSAQRAVAIGLYRQLASMF